MISAVYQWFSHPISDHYQELFAYVPTIRFIGLYPSTKRTALQYASLTGGRLPGPLIIRGPTEIKNTGEIKELWRTETFGDTPSRLGLWSRLKSSKSSVVYYYFGFIVSVNSVTINGSFISIM